jgi:hypothetical protein
MLLREVVDSPHPLNEDKYGFLSDSPIPQPLPWLAKILISGHLGPGKGEKSKGSLARSLLRAKLPLDFSPSLVFFNGGGGWGERADWQ